MYQQITIIGHVGQAPDLRYTATADSVCSFSVAVNKRWTNADGSKGDKTAWFSVSAWRGLADICNQYVKKGMLIMVVGEIDASYYVGKDGQGRVSLNLTAKEVKFLSSRDDGGDAAEFGSGSTNNAKDNDIPF